MPRRCFVFVTAVLQGANVMSFTKQLQADRRNLRVIKYIYAQNAYIITAQIERIYVQFDTVFCATINLHTSTGVQLIGKSEQTVLTTTSCDGVAGGGAFEV